MGVLLSIIIPSRNEIYLQKTIDDIVAKSAVEIEIIVVLDGYWPDPPLKDYKNLFIIHRSTPYGMRNAINSAVSISKGKYLMKCDAHCCFDKGFDDKLINDYVENSILVPVRYDLNTDTWDRMGLPHEFQYMRKDDLRGKEWPEYSSRVEGQKLVDIMSSQGSCWLMSRSWFDKLGGLDEINYGTIGRETFEITTKTWEMGGRYILDRNTWYAHRPPVKEYAYPRPHDEVRKSIAYAESKRDSIIPIIDKFSPVPTWNEQPKKENPTFVKGIGRRDLYKQWQEKGFKIGAEIGVWDGINAWHIIHNIPDLEKLYLVDPYQDYIGSRIIRGEERLISAWEKAHKNTRNKNVEFMKMTSIEASKLIKDESLDFVYIDGNHTYDFVMLDIILWTPKVRKGGIVSGHDYYYDPKRNVEVRKAVDDYTSIHGIEFFITDKMAEKNGKRAMTSWFWEKK